MPSVLKRGGTWYVKFRNAGGTAERKATTATTKAEARLLGLELEQKAERQRLGLEARPTDDRLTVAGLCNWWLENYCPPRSVEMERMRLGKYVLSPPASWSPKLGDVPLHVVTAEDFDHLFRAMELAGLAPASINRLRSMLHSAYETAIRKRKWSGRNEVSATETRKVVKKIHPTLTGPEADLVLKHVNPDWRDLFAAALYTGMRKGELLGLLKSDVDLQRLELKVSKSYDKEGTKSDRVDVLPIAEPLVPYLRHALESSPSAWLFPGPKGKPRTKESDPHKVLKTALRHAGIITGYRHICRRCDAPPLELADNLLRRCEACGMKLWITPVEKAMVFHDLRHTTATLLLRAGVDWHRVQRILRHSDIKVTLGTYAHLEVEDLRGAVNILGRRGPTEVQAPESAPRREVS